MLIQQMNFRVLSLFKYQMNKFPELLVPAEGAEVAEILKYLTQVRAQSLSELFSSFSMLGRTYFQPQTRCFLPTHTETTASENPQRNVICQKELFVIFLNHGTLMIRKGKPHFLTR